MKQQISRKELFESVPVNKALMTMAVPTIISQLINLVYNMVDTIFIGQTGDAYKTAAVTVAFTLFMMTVAFANLFGIGGGSLMARLAGQGAMKRARGVCAFSFYGAIAIALLYSAIIAIFMNPLLNLLGASPDTIEYARQYVFYVVILGDLPVVLSGASAHLLRNSGYANQASIGLSLGGVLNMILDPIFMFVILPKGMEVTGAAVATLLANVVSCIYLIIVMLKLSKKAAVSINPADIRLMKEGDMKSVFAVGVPSSLLNALFDLANVFLIALMSDHGDMQLAAIGIVMKAERLPNAINIGICQGMLPIVAYNYASGNHKRMDAVVRSARKYGLAICSVTLIIFEIFSPFICRIFLNTDAGSGDAASTAAMTIVYAGIFLRIRCLASPFQFLNYSTSFSMQAVGYGKGTLIHPVVRQIAFYIPFMLILNRIFGVYGLTSAVVFGEAAGGAFALFLFHQWKKKNIRVEA